MLEYTGHPLLDVGTATIAAFAGKPDPATLTEQDLDAIAEYMEDNYTVDPLKSFLTVAFPNSGFTQPAFEKQPDKRRIYAERVLRAYRSGTPTLDISCIFTGERAVDVSLDVRGELEPGRTFRQHVPLLTSEGVINFHPYGDAGLPVSGKALLAFQALPLGCAKVSGRLLAVHSDDANLTYWFAHRFLEHNRRAIQTTQLAGDKKMPEYPRRPGTLVVEVLLDVEDERQRRAEDVRRAAMESRTKLSVEGERQQQAEEGLAASVTAYHLTNSGQGVALDIYHLPLEISDFLRVAMTSPYQDAWKALCARGWELSPLKRGAAEEPFTPRYNVLYEDLFRLPEQAASFVRCYFLRVPVWRSVPGDPRAVYSVKGEAGLVSWDLTTLFLGKVVNMNESRIESIRQLGDALAAYVNEENDRRFFQTLLTAKRYNDLRAALIRVSMACIKRGKPPLVQFDPYIQVFEEGEELAYKDWRLAKDLVLIRVIEQLHQLGWLKKHAEELPEPVADESETT